MVEVNDEGLVLVFAQHVIEKGVAGAALLVQNAPLAHARVHEQAERQGKIGFLREITDRLRMPVLFQDEIIFGQVADEASMFIAHRRQHAYHLHFDRNGRCLLAPQSLIRERHKNDQE